MPTTKIPGELEIDTERGVIYFHNREGYTTLRICGLEDIPKPVLCSCGKFATRTTIIGRKVCEEHKGQYTLESGLLHLYQLDYTFPKPDDDKDRKTVELSASEALFGFIAWLTTRKKVTFFSANLDAAPAADLIKIFCKVNNLSEPRVNWVEGCMMPKGS